MTEKTIGYARTASNENDINLQIEALKTAGCEIVYSDAATSGSSLDRPGLRQAKAALKPGDTFKVVGLNRISRDHQQLVTFLTQLQRNHIEVEAVDSREESAAALLILDRLSYGPAIEPDTPLWRKIAYRLGTFFIRISGRGQVPSS